ncbi:hypothetical protein ISD42_01655 [Pseudomonas aeruginosa]|uniref:hypothetical protein n=1 Tax=Pseudomonas aeruginosa TaxID=287 RepID=UPI001D6A44F8|nr:hypothetical protein [Pseudomonas aeruginosa]MBX6183672.1 hypothetical protein [Pseudomonas aeruginosa]MBX6209912.1 hypothetical protein [Pseudomonas aeruginosa]UJB98135.1 hypothetical protein HUK69_10785 [Pseudomonas aeruginosa]
MSAEKPRERPILFNDQMVRAILEGRKTVTRRAVKGLQIPTEDKTTPHEGLRWSALGQRHLRYGFNVFGSTEEECAHELARCGVCPFGKPGDRLWVRETFADIGCRLTFRADLEDGAHCSVTRWTPSLHMPRWASRILLEITAVHVERLQDISEEQALAEGVRGEPCDHARQACADIGCWGDTAKGAFGFLWESLNGEGIWAANPWVWVVEFKRVAP